MKEGSNTNKQVRRGVSVHKKIHEFFLRELEKKRKEIIKGENIELS